VARYRVIAAWHNRWCIETVAPLMFDCLDLAGRLALDPTSIGLRTHTERRLGLTLVGLWCTA
jgi:hypothetical protein